MKYVKLEVCLFETYAFKGISLDLKRFKGVFLQVLFDMKRYFKRK